MQRLAKEMSPSLRELAVSTLHLLILEHILGMPRELQERGDTIRYSQDEESVLQTLEKEDFQAAFILNATKKEEIQSIVAGGDKMPQKSTYFYPKLPSGLVVNKIEPEGRTNRRQSELVGKKSEYQNPEQKIDANKNSKLPIAKVA